METFHRRDNGEESWPGSSVDHGDTQGTERCVISFDGMKFELGLFWGGEGGKMVSKWQGGTGRKSTAILSQWSKD